MKSIIGTKKVLRSLLLLINGFESEEDETLALKARSLLDDLRRSIACSLLDNGEIALFDSVFAASGWDDQGFRWCRDEQQHIEGRLVMTLRIVEFTDKEKTTWTPI